MLRRGFFPRVGAYAVLALGFWLLFQAFERSNILTGIVGGAVIIVGMYLMTGVWRETFARFGGKSRGRPRGRKENGSSDNTPDDAAEGTGDTLIGSDQSGQLPP